MIHGTIIWILTLCLVIGSPPDVRADQNSTAQTNNSPGKPVFPDYTDTMTRHALQVGDRQLVYTATTGALPIHDTLRQPQGTMFYVSYTMQDTDFTQRPITFVLNGGPGAAAVYLHLGALGPKRLVFNDDGTLPAAPARLIDNPFTWLTFTDLVFIDPIGTGYSRSVQQDDKQKQPPKFWGIEEDLQSLEIFIQLYLTRQQRWLSPKFLAGESYGGFRVAALSARLQAETRIALNGILLISPVLEFSLLTGDHYHVLPWVLRLPSYAAVARFHGKAPWPQDAGQELAAIQTIVEHFSITEVLPGLAQGDRLAEAQAQALYTRLAQAIGVPAELLRRSRGRLSPGVFAKTLLQETQRLLSLYDGSVTAIDPTPERPVHTGQDPRLDQLSAAFTAAFNSYVREELHFVTDVPYHTLNTAVSKAWDWRSGIDAPQGFAGTADLLKTALSHNPGLYAFIAHGYYDLVTPYFSSIFVVHQMALDEAIQSHMVLRVYAGGHMFYTHAMAHEQLWRDVYGFFHRAIPGSAVPPSNVPSRP